MNKRRATVADRLEQFAGDVELRVRGFFAGAQLAYPPRELAFVAFKDIRRFEVYGRDVPAMQWKFVREYRVLGASGDWLRNLYAQLRAELDQFTRAR